MNLILDIIVKGGENIKKAKKTVLMLILIISMLFGLNIVSAMDSNDLATDFDSIRESIDSDSKIYEISQCSTSTENKGVDGINYSSANDNNSLNCPQDNIGLNSYLNIDASKACLNSIVKNELLGMANYDEILSSNSYGPYTHDYEYSFYNDETPILLSYFRDINCLSHQDGNDIVYWTPIINGYLYLIIDSNHITKINWIRINGNKHNE